MLSYLHFHMLQSQCENNHLIKKKKEKSRENKSNEAIPGLSPSFHSWHSQSLLPSSCSSLHDRGSWKEIHETQHFSNFSSPSGLGNMGKDVVSIRICCS